MVSHLEHNHDESNINGKFKCEACDAIKQNLQPSEDGLFAYEQENDVFIKTYCEIWDQLKEDGVLFEYETFFGVMVDN